MSILIKGDAIPNAREYQLYQVFPNPETIGFERTYYNLKGCVVDDGSISTEGSSADYIHTDFIALADLADGPEQFCFSRLPMDQDNLRMSIAFYSERGNFDSYVTGFAFEELPHDTWTAEEVLELADDESAKYIVISMRKGTPLFVYTKKKGYEYLVNENRFGKINLKLLSEYIDVDGSTIIESGWSHTDIIHIDQLENYGEDGECMNLISHADTDGNIPAIIFYRNSNESSYAGCIKFEEYGTRQWSKEMVKERARTLDAQYIICNGRCETVSGIMQYTNISLTSDIFFDLSLSGINFSQGTQYSFVVKAIGEGGADINGDGIIYTDSEYCVGEDGNPLTCVPNK